MTLWMFVACVAAGILVLAWSWGRSRVEQVDLPSFSDRVPDSVSYSLLFLAVAGVAVAVAAVSVRPFSAPPDVTLPIEVIGADGTVESVTVSASDASGVESLFLKAYSIGYPSWERYDVNKASIRINGGSWIDVTSNVAQCKFPESNLNCVEGPYHTIRFEIPISAFGSPGLTSGDNNIEFRFNYAFPSDSPDSHGDVSTGYRILDLELRRSDDSDAIDGTTFGWDDPAGWDAPDNFDDAASVADGKALWEQRDVLLDGWNGPEIRASCADCHATNGYDLQYFAFSNKSIIERSKFHGLSESQGKKIAAYIRSVTLEDPETGVDYAPPGRPWHPPYQPGPTTVSSRTDPGDRTSGTTSMMEGGAITWSAGAGVEWALDRDKEMKPFLFPGGVDDSDLALDNSLMLPSIPTPIQYPDWNEWLPTHHPLDIWGDTFVNGSGGAREDPHFQWYDPNGPRFDVVNDCEASTTTYDCVNGAGRLAKRIWEHSKLFNHDAPTQAEYSDLTHGFRQAQMHKWGAVKSWEIFTTFHLEDNGTAAEPDAGPLQWVTKSRLPFDIPPHIVGAYDDVWDRNSPWDLWMDNAWYDLHTTIAHGRGVDVGISPNDWVYQHMHMKDYRSNFGVPFAFRYVRSAAKVQQNCSLEDGANETFIAPTVPASWFQRVGHCDFGGTWFGHGGFVPGELDQYEPGLSTRVYEAAFRAHVEGMTSHPLSEWSRETGENGWEPESFTPSFSDGWFDSRETPSHLLKSLKRLNDMGVAATPIGKMAVWGEQMNPSGDWEQFMCEKDGGPLSCADPNDPTVSITSPSNGDSFTAPATFSLTADASDNDGSISTVTFSVGNTQIAEVTSAPYEATWEDAAAGIYTLTAQATDDAGNTTSTSVNVNVSGPTSENNGLSYSYYEGDWTQLPDFGGLSAVTTGTTSGFDLSVRERDDQFGLQFVGYIDVPSSDAGTHTFYTTSDDGSRLLVNGQEVVNNDGVHAPEEASGTIDLSAGRHSITVEFFEQAGGEALTVQWETPTLLKQAIPEGRLFRSASAGTNQEITLTPGWNLISSRIAPSDDNISTVFSDVESALVVVQDQQGDRYDPAAATNSLETWDSSQGYRVYMSEDQTLRVEGGPLSTTTLDLTTGWNLIPFYPTNEMSVEDAFASISGTVEMVKDAAGHSYIPGRNLDEIWTLKPGQAYKVYVNEATSFSYP